MFTINNFLKNLLGIFMGIAMLWIAGRIFFTYFIYSFGTLISFIVAPVILGYIYIAVGLARSKEWAQFIAVTIFGLSIIIEFLLIVFGLTGTRVNIVEELSHLIFWVSLVAIPVFGISALIRKKCNNKQ
ncbi:MAG: hypothetical protein M0R00_03705 [Candidatus Omnitrophica bacterium]|jgi:hypothetical protein|nr:hypothetical protein [Candidatus Omnitrophota bacterium]